MKTDTNENLLDEKVDLAALVPKEEQLVPSGMDFSNVSVKCDKREWTDLFPEGELAVDEDVENQEADEIGRISPEFFSPTNGLAQIENVLDDRLLSGIYTDEKGHRFFEFCQRYSDGTLSSRMKISQADLYRLAMYDFQVEKIPAQHEKQKAKKFLSKFFDIYLGQLAKDEILAPEEVLRVLFSVRNKLPTRYENPELPAQQLYRRVVDVLKNEMSSYTCLGLFKKTPIMYCFGMICRRSQST